jgi:hypothetical protein
MRKKSAVPKDIKEILAYADKVKKISAVRRTALKAAQFKSLSEFLKEREAFYNVRNEGDEITLNDFTFYKLNPDVEKRL